MTCIVGLIDGKTIWMGGDSAGVSGHNTTIRLDKKIFVKNNMIFGYTSSFRMGQLLRFSLSIPQRRIGQDTYEYMCTEFINSVRSCFEHGGFSKKVSGEESGGTFLVGYDGRLFNIEDDFQVGENSCNYGSVGCGWSYSLGSLYSTESSIDPEFRVRKALECAEFFSGGVKGPFTIEKLTCE